MFTRLTILARHYSYECKVQLQERPYNARPSRTQQLLNPKLVPKLTNDTPDDATRKYASELPFAPLSFLFIMGSANPTSERVLRMRSWQGRRLKELASGS